jgi:hypothetical protein
MKILPARDFSRRGLLAGLGAGFASTALLPLLDAHRARGASLFPKRLITIVWPNGVLAGEFWPKDAQNPTSSTNLAPLADLKDDVLVVGNTELRAMKDTVPPHGGHTSFPFLLTGYGKADGPNFGAGPDPIADSLSIDQHVANAIKSKAPTPIHSLVLAACSNEGKSTLKYVSYKGPRSGTTPDAVPTEEDHQRLYNTLFQGRALSVADDPALGRLLAERRSVLDTVGRDLQAMSMRLGGEDRAKIQAHLQGVTELERQLQEAAKPGGTSKCTAPTIPQGVDRKKSANIPQIMRIQADLVVAAMRCDITRVASLVWSNNHNNEVTFGHIGISGGGSEFGAGLDHHEIAHHPNLGKPKVDTWFVSQLAYFLKKLKETPEGGGTMLDNSLVLFANSFIDGGAHNVVGGQGLPWIIGGKAGGYIKTGRYLKQSGNVPHNRVLVAIANAMDAPVEFFGDRKYGGELDGIRG